MKTTRLRRLASLRVERATKPGPTLSLDGVESRTGKLISDPPHADATGQIRFHPGDVLFGKLRPYLAKSFEVTEEVQGSAEFLCMTPGPKLDSTYLKYVTLSNAWLDFAVMHSYGTKMPRTSWDQMGSFEVPEVGLKEQRRVASFLDDRVSRIDGVIAARGEQIELAQSMLWAVFEEALQATAAPDVPLRRVISYIADGPFGSAFSSADYAEEGPAVIRLGNIGLAEFRDADLARVPDKIYDAYPRSHIHAGDLLIASLGDASNHAGRACVAPGSLGPAMVKGKCFVARPVPDKSTAEYLALVLSSPGGAQILAMQGRGATRNMLNFDLLLSSRFPVPAYAQQRALVRDYSAQRERMLNGRSALLKSVALLTEYKQSLITAAVAGELDVTTASKRVPA